MDTIIALPSTLTPISAAGEQYKDANFAALVRLSEERAAQVLEYVTHMKFVRQNWPEAWVIYAFDSEGPIYVPATEIQGINRNSGVILPDDFTPCHLLSIEDSALLVSAEGISWETVDATRSFKLNTKEIDDRFLRLLASGVPLGQG